jgi:hypothetical protein
VCSGSSSESDTDDDNHHGKLTKLLTSKRKNPTPANSASRKRQSQGPTRTKHMGRQGKPPISQNDAGLASKTKSSDTELRYGEDRSNESGEDDEAEYEVKGILNARMSGQKLQYRVKWLGFEYDPMWYDARNFKNSPYKLRDFHSVNRSHPGPPKRLGTWIQCWEEDRDAEDHPDDNKP